ncbi:dicarboxylate carrier SLC25A8-like [Lutzomyia longipalpis]|uniref:dicarboxylate carrier SLC25A8-like n=1 Tax=Lutzomyia longipalpis TaxID=7200 RepID=UPI0024836844|nr:dicarboxylate carrier SLC25A8-like [Lutzomyia longipalpis]XP_055692662.1 dicarboxylate carrier SLC25A8-like [Lutzomyia longipalpis]XP_055692663.1 dicarboxylate carrier SLC25A8-like [Lutzomyia longipalpis]XP_055692664.1 dicarboxylate carrier SLC25A8-like [Lutzomyia longipalpis]XP_055692665.1 dicarboxylate carrier SLC25A8-like [Lutzomyia longipalpis]XP_055692666.1 dicarboxylate carrier SLC25A8-like [Lutzomyia longipalpis]XP_055692668.1 dicarboxylate carrier SLC25A8-like [Lutzomyia longipalpi
MVQSKNTSANLEASFGVRLLTAGTAACIADFVTFPLDTAKVRLQIQGEGQIRIPLSTATANGATVVSAGAPPPAAQYRGLVGTVSTIVRQEGFRALYNGLSAGLQRQMAFASVRLGAYDSVKMLYQRVLRENPEGLQIFTRVLAGFTTGGMAVMLAQPTDVVKVRFQAQNRTTASPNSVRYRSTLSAYRTIGRDEGVRGLWKGTLPNVGRNAIVNVAEIVCYDIIKECLLKYTPMEDAIPCHFTAAVIAGFATTVAASPIDVVKTRYMNSKPGQYRGAIDCAIQMGRGEGASAFYKGFVPSFARLVSWNIVLWITYEQLKILIFKPPRKE